MAGRRPRSRQPELFARSKRSVIEIAPTHRLVMITEETDWTALEELVQGIRRRKLKNEAGRPPHLRALIGAVMFRALRKMSYRDTEDQIPGSASGCPAAAARFAAQCDGIGAGRSTRRIRSGTGAAAPRRGYSRESTPIKRH